MFKQILTGSILMSTFMAAPDAHAQQPQAETVLRPAIHFTPQKGWMNDPNGLVYYNGQYHLFFQHTPPSTIPDFTRMHWGHAVSKDLITWEEMESALKPDELGAIFSGSAVADVHNTSGFAKNGEVPLVAIFTNHDSKGEKVGREDFQTQGIAYSLDEGKTWTKYAGNPVVKNPGIRDFRDPKVFWYAPQNKWIMTLATLDHISFYSSPDLKEWKAESKFGKDAGVHDGVWECPDLIAFDHNGEKVWVLIVNLNPGGPNGGSGTQYFTGQFNGTSFTPDHTEIKWLDYGPDEYAGITWENTGNRKILIGWMNNWKYASQVPATTWRGAMTIPRSLELKQVGNSYRIASQPVEELGKHIKGNARWVRMKKNESVLGLKETSGPYRLKVKLSKAASFRIRLYNELQEEVFLGFDKASNSFYIDRSGSGRVDFLKDFGTKYLAPRLSAAEEMDLTLIVDHTSVEVFADKGLTSMTSLCFPNAPFSCISLEKGMDGTKGARVSWKLDEIRKANVGR